MRCRIEATGVSVLYIEMVGLSEATRVADYRPMLERRRGDRRIAASASAGTRPTSLWSPSAWLRCATLPATTTSRSTSSSCRSGPVKTFTDALGVVRRADRPNAHIMVDALHVFRSDSSLDDIRKADREVPRHLPDLRCAARSAACRPARHRGPHPPTAAGPRRSASVGADRCAAGGHSRRVRAADRQPVPAASIRRRGCS